MNATVISELTRKEAQQMGYATYNNDSHTVVDLTHMNEGTHTITLRLPGGQDVTFSAVPFFSTDGGKTATIDIKPHKKDGETKIQNNTFGKNTEELIGEQYTLWIK